MVVRFLSFMGQPASIYPQEDSWYTFLYEAELFPKLSYLGGVGQMKNPMTSSGTEPATFRLVA
jgi:hypothetical protein